MMIDWIVAILILIGGAFSLVAAVGVLRMPDLYMRIQAATKSATAGASSLVLAAAILFADFGESARGILVIAFLLLTAPIAAHMISRAAYAAKVPLWDRTIIDEMSEHEGHALSQSRGREDREVSPSHE